MHTRLKHKAQFYRQLRTGFASGMQLEQILRDDVLPTPYAKYSKQLGRGVRSGIPLSGTLLAAKITGAWESRLLSIGETNGQLDVVLGDLAEFFETRSRQLASIKTRLLYPFLVLLVAILVQPLPAVAAGDMQVSTYLIGVVMRLLIVYAIYTLCFVIPFERASSSAFNPVLVFCLRWVGNTHWLRLQFEIAYLNLLTLCIASGLDTFASLKLLRESAANPDYQKQHATAIKLIEKKGANLTQALVSSGLIKHPMVQTFLRTNETSGTIHTDLREFVSRMKDETARTAVHFVKQVGFVLYVLGLGILLAGYL
ncbi:MAG: type II secretion system F family protein [Pseudomonadota bacterium]